MRTKTQAVVLFNPLTAKARHYNSLALAAKALGRDVSTVHRAMTGDRGRKSVAGNLVIPVA